MSKFDQMDAEAYYINQLDQSILFLGASWPSHVKKQNQKTVHHFGLKYLREFLCVCVIDLMLCILRNTD